MSKKQKELKQPDAFISFSDKLIKKFEENFKPIISVVLLLFVGGGLFAGIKTFQKRQERKAMESFYIAEKLVTDKKKSLSEARAELQKALDEANKAKKAKNKKAMAEALPEEPKTLEALKKNYSEAIAAYEKTIKKHSGRKASYIAALALAQLYSEYGEKEKAAQILNDNVGSLEEKDFFFGLMHNRLGSVLAGLGQCDKANGHFGQVISAASQSHLHPVAYLNRGLCFESLNQLDKAKELYKKTSDEFSDTEAGRSAKAYLRLLSLKKLPKGE